MSTLRRPRAILVGVGIVVFVAAAVLIVLRPRETWSDDETTTIKSLWIGSLKKLPLDPSNKYADDPRAASLGQKLFFDTRFSANGKVACVTCHQPGKEFQDGLPLAKGVGTTTRRAMTLVGTAYSPWFFWDGRKDSQWSQATGPMESAVEHGGNRGQYAHLIAQYYKDEYEAIFGPLPDLSHLPANAGPVKDEEAAAAWMAMSAEDQTAVSRIYANMGKAIAAYERLLVPGPSRFDTYSEAVITGSPVGRDALTADEAAGLRLFIGKANCTQCHNGPLFTDNAFHNTGVPDAAGLPADTGRAQGAKQVLADEFNCLGPFSDAGPDDCAELKFMTSDGEQLIHAFKPPSLRNVDGRGPYMHAGQYTTLEQVLAHYNSAPAAPTGHSDIHPLHLSDQEIGQIIAFLKSLSGPLAADPKWLKAASN